MASRLVTILFGISSVCSDVFHNLSSNNGPRVSAPCGKIVGTTVTTRNGTSVDAFLGIPFAHPPIGALRFEPPVPLDPWNDGYDATEQPKRCIQIIDINASEDCLYLNVYSRDVGAQPFLPVLVWIFGGAFEFGSVMDYTPEYLMDHRLVYVAMNWRQGLFGYFSTGDTLVPGNMGLKDILLALRWVQKNIKAFGGDPEKVTIFGESSGATAVHYFMTMKSNEGLFRAAICHSGSALNPFALRPPVDVQKTRQAIVSLTGCPGDSKGLVECLKNKTAHELLILYEVSLKNLLYFPLQLTFSQFAPLVGPVLEPGDAKEPFVTGNAWSVNTSIPFLAGVMGKEALIYFTAQLNDRSETLFTLFDLEFNKTFPLLMNYQNSEADGSRIVQNVRDFYLKNNTISRATLEPSANMISEGYFSYATTEAILRNDPEKTFVFLFDYRSTTEIFPIPPDGRIGSSHTDDLMVFFPHPGLPAYPRVITEEDRLMSETLVRLWANFIDNLVPTPAGTEINWRRFSNNHSYLHIKQDGLETKEGFLNEMIEFWRKQPYPNRDDHYGSK